MKNNINKNIRLGLFVIIGTVLFIISMYLIGEKQNLFGSTFTVQTVFKNVNGLQKGNNVRYSGIDIGTVQSITMLNDTSILVSMIIKDEMRQFIRKDARAAIGTDGLLGNRLINISPGNIASSTVSSGDTLLALYGMDEGEMLRILERTNKNVEIITSGLVGITKEIQRGEGTVGKLISDPYLADNIETTLANIKKSSEKMNQIFTSIEKNVNQINLGEGTLGALLMDTSFASNIELIISDFAATSKNTNEITEELKVLIQNIRSGKGAAGSIVADTTLALNLEESIENIQMGSAAFNENMEALKHNFLFRGYFKKQEKKKKKK
ncbi:MlaD family protein [Ekhidna sp.]